MMPLINWLGFDGTGTVACPKLTSNPVTGETAPCLAWLLNQNRDPETSLIFIRPGFEMTNESKVFNLVMLNSFQGNLAMVACREGKR